jgi:diguanylate cyclase (GGDEF)-like protein
MRARFAKFGNVLWIPLTALALAWAFSLTSLYQKLDALAFDAQARLVAQEHYFTDTLMIDIDDASLREMQPYLGGWPYKRDVYAMLIDYLGEMGARTVALDVVFADPREGDARLQASIARAPHIVLAATALSETIAGEQAIPSNLVWKVPADLPASVWPGVQLPLPMLTQAQSGVEAGVISVQADRDGVLRRIPLFHQFRGQYLPAMPLATQGAGGPRPPVRVQSGGTIQVGDRAWPVDSRGEVCLQFPRNLNSVLSMPFSRVGLAMLGMPGQALDPAVFRGKTIFVGSSALYYDRILTPAGDMHGLYFLATAHQLLAHNLTLKPRHWAWTGLLLLIALLPALLLLKYPQRFALAGANLSLAAAVAVYLTHLGALYALKQENSLLLPLLAVSIAGLLEALRAVRLKETKQKKKIHALANNDPLTQLPNRISMQGQLALAIDNASAHRGSLVVLSIGLDDLKSINNTLGHEIGDQVLIETASRFRACAQSDCIVARLGGKEFGVMVRNATMIDATLYADAILRVVAKPYLVGKHELRVTCSVGISMYPTDGADAALLLKHADTALSHAKAQGRNTYHVFTADLSEIAMERLQIENQLHLALTRNELALHYQPKVDTQTGRLSGAEALVRWNHPVRGLLGPGYFIPIAESSDLALPLGEWILRATCRQIRAWHQEGFVLNGRVAVNLSASQFEQAGLPAQIASILEETGVDARCIELEITESVAMTHPERSIETLKALRAMGLTIAVDDFGTGYASLSYLRMFPVTSLKIDSSFVRNIETDPHDAAICASTIALAHQLGLKVVAEGIERAGQYQFLKQHQCGEIQGYLISHPLSAEAFSRFVSFNVEQRAALTASPLCPSGCSPSGRVP